MDLSKYPASLAAFHDTTVRRFTKKSAASGYVGSTYSWQPQETLSCGCYPVKDERSIELYGPRVDKMFRLHFAPGTAISDGDGVAFDSTAAVPTYTVIGVRKRKMQIVALVEVIGIGN